MRFVILTAFLVGISGSAARADEPATDAVNVQMMFDSVVQKGLWVLGHDEGWTVPLSVDVATDCSVRLHDVTPLPVPLVDHVEPIAAHQHLLSLPRPRYTGNHTYRVTVACGKTKTAPLLVHLDPSAEEIASWMGDEPKSQQVASRN